MKVQDLRKLLSEADRERLEKAFVECYKIFSKNRKEEIDDMIISILAGNDVKKKEKAEQVDFEALEKEILAFVENAYAQNYFVPNRVIPKSQRPKWRFLVKDYIKQLQKIPVGSEYFSRGVKLLRDLYHMLCYGCRDSIFSTEDPFRSVGWGQKELFGLLVKKTFSLGYSKENISQLLADACGGGLSMEALHIENMLGLLSELKNSDVRYTAIEAAKELVEEKMEKLSSLKKNAHGSYNLLETANNLCGMVLMIGIVLAEPEDGVEYFFNCCKEPTPEIVLYKALDYVDYVGDDKLWMWVYEYGVKRKIKPRESLVREYERLKAEI